MFNFSVLLDMISSGWYRARTCLGLASSPILVVGNSACKNQKKYRTFALGGTTGTGVGYTGSRQKCACPHRCQSRPGPQQHLCARERQLQRSKCIVGRTPYSGGCTCVLSNPVSSLDILVNPFMMLVEFPR